MKRKEKKMHKKGVNKFFEVHGNMGIKLEAIDDTWPKRAVVTVDELRDALTSKMREWQDYFEKHFVKEIIREVLLEDFVKEIIREVLEEKGKTEIDYKAYYESIPILINFIKEQEQVGNKKAHETLKKWDDSYPGGVDVK